MSFDWFTFIAQLVNFGLLLVLLRVFLYRPVLNMMDQREEHLASTWKEAEEAKTEAREQADRLAAELASVEEQRRTRLAEVEAEARELLDRRLAEVEAEVDESRARQHAALEESRERTVQRLRHRTAEVLLGELHSSLTDLAGTGLAEQAIRVFTERLSGLPDQPLQDLRKAAKSGQLEITTAAGLTQEQQAELTGAVHSLLQTDAAIRFTVDTGLLFGTELRAGAMLVSVSGRQRLEALEAEFARSLGGLGAANATG